MLRVQGPLGIMFVRDRGDRRMFVMGGGTGFSPVKGIVERGLQVGTPRPMDIYGGARAESDRYLDHLPRQWAEQHDAIDYTPVLSEPASDGDWAGATGFVHQQVLADHPDLSGFDVYMSGPPPMIHAARDAFIAAGLPADRLFYDSFEAGGD